MEVPSRSAVTACARKQGAKGAHDTSMATLLRDDLFHKQTHLTTSCIGSVEYHAGMETAGADGIARLLICFKLLHVFAAERMGGCRSVATTKDSLSCEVVLQPW